MQKPADSIQGGVGTSVAHDSAARHVTGSATYIDDIAEPAGTLHTALGLSDCAHGKVTKLDLDEVRAAPGVVAVLAASDLTGPNDVGPVVADDPIFADGVVEYVGQCLFAVAAESLEAARAAARLARVEYEALPALISVDDALAADHDLNPPLTMRIGDAEKALAAAPRLLEGGLAMGGQDHFYLEGQIALAVPGEGADMLVHSSTQHPSEVQHLVAKSLQVPDAAVTVEVRRMGGGFGGKETQPAHIAAIAALLARATGRPVKLRLDRDTDMMLTGKRHDFRARWKLGHDDAGRLMGVEIDLAARCGRSTDLSNPVCDRAMFHADNCYFLGDARVTARRMKTHTQSNTAFRGFGGPQGMLAIETAMDEIARATGRDPLDVRKANFYGTTDRNVTHYHQTVEGNIIHDLVDELEQSSDYRQRVAALKAHNATNPVIRRGIALTPVKFGISFTLTMLNQAGALLHVYTDGSVHLNHGGTEMGQGVNIKVAQVVAEEFQIDLDKVRITATSTGKVPNTSATAASSGADLNGMAARIAAGQIKDRLIAFAAEKHNVPAEQVVFRAGQVFIGNEAVPFARLVRQAYENRIHLSAAGFYKTPEISWDRAAARGRPFYYYAWGAACSEVAIDTLTGETSITRVDILHDVGRSLNPAIDLGQIEGGFVQGAGWLTSEELWFDKAGRLRTHAPSTYKIPTSRDVPPDFRVAFFDQENPKDTIHRSKAVGEPPFMLAISVFMAIRDAVASARDYQRAAPLDAPATPERVLLALEALKSGD